MEKIILASNNAHKIKEFKEIFNTYEVVPMKEIGFNEDIIEDGTTFEENSKIKTSAISNFLKSKNLNYMVMADDSGLCVEALNGEPGVYSARYGGNHNDQQNRDFLLKNLEGKINRNAKFVCVITLQKPNGETIVGKGEVNGTILTKEVGDTSFGYDCLFHSTELNKCFGLATAEEKNSVSHRGRAIKDLLNKLNMSK